MFTVATYLDRSALHGIGVFAGQDIARGQIVWQFNPLLDLAYSYDEWLALQAADSPHSFTHIRRYSYKEGDRFYLCLDNAQFMNHSSEGHNVENNRELNTMVARTAITRGEELLCNYFEYCDEDDYNLMKIKG